MVRGVKFFTYIAAGLLLVLSLAVTSCELGLFDTVKKEVEDYYADLAGSPKIVVKKGIWDVPDGSELDIGLAEPQPAGTPKTVILTIENSGTGELNLTGSPRVNLDNFTDFDILSLPPSVIGPGQNAIFTLEFAPGAIGPKTTQVIIANDASPDGSYTFTLKGRGATFGPEIEVRQGASTVIAASDNFNAGGTAPNTTLSTIFTISNIGTPGSTLEISSVAITGSGTFTLPLPVTANLGEGVSTDFTVDFSPTLKTDIPYSGAITIAHDSVAITSPFQFTISAGVLYSDINVKQGATGLDDGIGSYTFVNPVMADGNNETASSYVTFTIENQGTTNLTVSNIWLIGTDPSDFDRLGSTTATVQASGTTTFSIRFDPLTVGTGNKTASVNIANNDPDTSKSTYTFDVTGTATKAPKIYFSQYDKLGVPLYRANLNGSNMEKLGGSFVYAGQVALDPANEMIYVATAKGIFEVTYAGEITLLIEAGGVAGVALDLTNGFIYWTENTATEARVRRVDLALKTSPEYLVTVKKPGFRHLALDTVTVGGLMYVAHEAGVILVYSLDGTYNTEIEAPDPYGLALDLKNGLIYYTSYNYGLIYQDTTGGGNRKELVVDTKGVAGIALDLNDGEIYWSNIGDGTIKRALIIKPEYEILKTERMRCFGIALDLVP